MVGMHGWLTADCGLVKRIVTVCNYWRRVEMSKKPFFEKVLAHQKVYIRVVAI